MNDNLAIQLGELQTQIYWLHDTEKFPELALAAATIYQQLGYSQEQSKIAGKLISEAYQLADDAELAYQGDNYAQEMQYYHQVKDKLVGVEKILNYQYSIAIYQMKWWLYFRHQQKLQVILNLFLQHFKSVGSLNLLTAIKLTYYLMEIGRVHKQRDIETTRKNARKYWIELLKNQSIQYPYLG